MERKRERGRGRKFIRLKNFYNQNISNYITCTLKLLKNVSKYLLIKSILQND